MSERARALPAKPRRTASATSRAPRRDDALSDEASAVRRLGAEAGNRATLHALDPAQLHPDHEHRERAVGANRYEVLGVEVPRPRGGKPIQRVLRGQLERAFDTDLSGIRVREHASANDLDALAYTRGADITVAPGHYQPHSGSGQQLVAHEVVHVIQQRAGRVPSPTEEEGGLPVNEDRSLEREADRLGRRASWGLPAPVFGGRERVVRKPTGVTQPSHGSM